MITINETLSLILIWSLPFFSSEKEEYIDNLHESAYSLLKTNTDSARLIAQEALKSSEEFGYDWGEANANWILGYLNYRENKLDQALLHYLKADNKMSNIKSEIAIETHVQVLTNIGIVLYHSFEYDQSISYFNQALEIASDEGFSKRSLIASYNLGLVNQRKGDLPAAIESLKLALDLAQNLNETDRLFRIWNVLGLIYKDNKDFETANNHFLKIIQNENANDRIKGQALHNIGLIHMERGELEVAQDYYHRAISIKQNVSSPLQLFRTYYRLAETYFKMDRVSEALNYVNKSEELYESTGLHEETFKVFHLKSSILFESGDFKSSQEYSNRYFKESSNFQERQEEIIRLVQSYKAQVMVAAHKNEVTFNKRKAKLVGGIGVVSGLVMLLIIGIPLGFRNFLRTKRRVTESKLGAEITKYILEQDLRNLSKPGV